MEPVTITSYSRVKWSTDQISTEVDGSVVLMSIRKGRYFDLDDVAADIWRRLAQPVRVADLCAGLAAEYDADRETIERDVLPWLERLHSERLIDVECP